jgi:hypothetical protein
MEMMTTTMMLQQQLQQSLSPSSFRSFFAFGNFNSFAQVFVYTSYDKKRRTRKVCIFESALPFK